MSRKRVDPQSLPGIARRLNLLRRAVSSSQAEFCRMTGIGTSTWSEYEGGSGRINVDTATLLWKRFGASLDWIYNGVEAMLPSKLLSDIREIEAEDRKDGQADEA